jgi:hypothetical protein
VARWSASSRIEDVAAGLEVHDVGTPRLRGVDRVAVLAGAVVERAARDEQHLVALSNAAAGSRVVAVDRHDPHAGRRGRQRLGAARGVISAAGTPRRSQLG